MDEDSVKHDDIVDFAIYYCLHDGSYPDGLTKEKKRAVRKRAAKLETEKGEVFLLRKGKRIKVVLTETSYPPTTESREPSSYPLELN